MPADRLLVRGGGFYIWEAKDYIVGSFLPTQPPATTARAAAAKLLTRNLYFTHLHLGKRVTQSMVFGVRCVRGAWLVSAICVALQTLETELSSGM